MSWSIESKRTYKCPCGDGEYLEITEGDDWNRQITSHEMLCPKCKNKYVYNYSEVENRHKGKELERGWVLKDKTNVE